MPSLKNNQTGVMPEGFDASEIEDAKTLKKMLREHKKKQQTGPRTKVFRRILGYIFKYYRARFILVVISSV